MSNKKIFLPRFEAVLFAVLALSILFSYGNILTHAFTGYDDDKYVTENPQVQQGMTTENILWAFRSIHASNWHPLTWLSHMLDVELFGMNSGGHHFTSLLLHLLNSLLLFAVLQRMTGEIWKSWAVAMLFAVHPLHVESVAWIAERKDVLSTFFGLLVLRSYALHVKNPKTNRYLPIIAWYLFSLLSKPMLVTLPFVLLLLDYWPLQRISISLGTASGNAQPTALSVLHLLQEKIPLFLLTFASCAVTFFAQHKGNAVGEYPLGLRTANALTTYTAYIWKMLWPCNLGVLYPYPKMVPIWQTLSAAFLLGSISFLAVRHRKQAPWLLVGWLWYLGTLVPVIGVVQVGVQAMADRYTYIPLTGLFIILAWGASTAIRSWRQEKIILLVLAAAYFAALTVATRMQAAYWRDSITLFEHTLQVTDNNYVIHNNLGFELALQGQYSKASEQYKAAVRINPDFEQAYINYGSMLFASGQIKESLAYHQDVLKTKPYFAGMHYNFGVQLLRTGQLDAAAAHLQKTLQLKPGFAAAYNSLGAVMLSEGNLAAAAALFQKALQIDPDQGDARRNLNSVLEHLQKAQHKASP